MNHKDDQNMIELHGIKFPRAWLQSHTLVTGTTGSGKTNGIIKPLLNQLLAQGDAAVIFDPKGDLLQITKNALTRCGREQDLVTLGVDEHDHTYNPLGDPTVAPSQLANQIVTASGMSLSGDSPSQKGASEDLFWSTARSELLCAVIELARKALEGTATPLHFGHLTKLRATLVQSQHQIQKFAKENAPLLSEMGGAALTEYAALPDSTRACVMTSVTNLLAKFQRSPVSDMVIPTTSRPAIELPELLNQNKVLVISTAQAEHAAELWPVFLMLKLALYKMILARPRLRVRQDNHLVVVLDEYARLMSSHEALSSEHVVLEAARTSKCSFILASQNLSGMEIIGGTNVVDKVASLCSNVCFLANSCPATARLAQRVLGIKKIRQRHDTTEFLPPPPLLFPQRRDCNRMTVVHTVHVPVEVPMVSPAALAKLQTGIGYMKLLDGTVRKLKCSFTD